MSKQLSIAAAASMFAMSAMALLSPGSARLGELPGRVGAATGSAAPSLAGQAPDLLPALALLSRSASFVDR